MGRLTNRSADPATISRREALALLLGTLAAPALARLPADPQRGLLFGPGEPGWWDAERVSCPRVLREGPRRWKMWYYGRDPGFDPQVFLPTGRVGLAISSDGVHWRRVRGPLTRGAVFEPSADATRFDSSHVGVSSVTRVGREYVMWYFGGDQSLVAMGAAQARGFPLRAGRATSRDGIHWQRTPGSFRGALLDVGEPGSYDAAFVGWPQLLEDDDGWKLYYHTFDPRQGYLACLAVSRDGLRWEKRGPVLGPGAKGAFDSGGCASRHVIRRGGRYLMFYEGNGGGTAFRGIGLAESPDGVNFNRVPGPNADGSVIAASPSGSGHWDAGGIGTPWVVPMPDGGLRLYHVGASESRSPDPAVIDRAGIINRIGMASCDGRDLTRWKRWET